ncbi:MAG: hypothetical protein K5886_04275 [Lachnospiraceae bacterium]|nr:hypothetical protein [Lachnospiraceae bacterium]
MDRISFFDGEQKLIVDIAENDITVNLLNSTDLGVAFLVRTEGKTFYHAGDLFCMLTIGEDEYLRRCAEIQRKFPGRRCRVMIYM